MRVSAILPVRNMHDVLPRALKSLAAQTYPLQQIVIADDASNPPLQAEGAEIVVNRGGSWGISGGRNAAFAQLRECDAVLPLDADDYIEPTYVEKTVRVLQERPEVGFVSTFMRYFGDSTRLVVDEPQVYETELVYNRVTVTSLIRTTALVQVGLWDSQLRAWEDWDLWLRLLKAGWQHAVVEEVLFKYYLSNGGMNSWANQPENKQRLYGYLLSKHAGFGVRKPNS